MGHEGQHDPKTFSGLTNLPLVPELLLPHGQGNQSHAPCWPLQTSPLSCPGGRLFDGTMEETCIRPFKCVSNHNDWAPIPRRVLASDAENRPVFYPTGCGRKLVATSPCARATQLKTVYRNIKVFTHSRSPVVGQHLQKVPAPNRRHHPSGGRAIAPNLHRLRSKGRQSHTEE